MSKKNLRQQRKPSLQKKQPALFWSPGK